MCLPRFLLRVVLVVTAMFALEGGKLLVDLVGSVLLGVPLSMDEFKERILSSWEAGARTREGSAVKT